MAEHTATIQWELGVDDFVSGRYARLHTWSFDGGVTVPGSPSPAVVPEPMSSHDAVDPEEAFVASVSSCHMLTFLYIAQRKGFVVERYRDDAVGKTARTDQGRYWVSEIALRPQIVYGDGKAPPHEQEQELHHLAHGQCFIANSVKTEIRIEKPQTTDSIKTEL
ncbi:MAG: OsmC family protein [Planctomycetota bacterium]